MRTGGDADGLRRKRDDLTGLAPLAVITLRDPFEGHCGDCAILIRYRVAWIHAFREIDALLERLDDFLVIEPVRWRILHALAVGNRHAAPGANERCEVRLLASIRSSLPLSTQRAGMHQLFVENATLLGVVGRQEL